jgi:hypothetical protein
MKIFDKDSNIKPCINVPILHGNLFELYSRARSTKQIFFKRL